MKKCLILVFIVLLLISAIGCGQKQSSSNSVSDGREDIGSKTTSSQGKTESEVLQPVEKPIDNINLKKGEVANLSGIELIVNSMSLENQEYKQGHAYAYVNYTIKNNLPYPVTFGTRNGAVGKEVTLAISYGSGEPVLAYNAGDPDSYYYYNIIPGQTCTATVKYDVASALVGSMKVVNAVSGGSLGISLNKESSKKEVLSPSFGKVYALDQSASVTFWEVNVTKIKTTQANLKENGQATLLALHVSLANTSTEDKEPPFYNDFSIASNDGATSPALDTHLPFDRNDDGDAWKALNYKIIDNGWPEIEGGYRYGSDAMVPPRYAGKGILAFILKPPAKKRYLILNIEKETDHDSNYDYETHRWVTKEVVKREAGYAVFDLGTL